MPISHHNVTYNTDQLYSVEIPRSGQSRKCLYQWNARRSEDVRKPVYLRGTKVDPIRTRNLGLTQIQGTAYTCAYAVMQIPSTLIIQKIRPSYWLACMEIGWGVFTFAQAGMQNVTQLYVFRFLVGLFESSFFPCMLFVLGSW